MTLHSPPKFGEAAFLATPPGVLAPMLRKRDGDELETVLDAEMSKRRRKGAEKEEVVGEAKWSVFGKSRKGFGDVGGEEGDDGEL